MKNKKVKKTIYMSQEMHEKVVNYISQKETDCYSYTEFFNLLLNNFFKIPTSKENTFIEKINNSISNNFNNYFERILKLQMKLAKSSYASIYILSKILANLYIEDDEKEFLKEIFSESDKVAYHAIKDLKLESNIQEMSKPILNKKNGQKHW